MDRVSHTQRCHAKSLDVTLRAAISWDRHEATASGEGNTTTLALFQPTHLDSIPPRQVSPPELS